MTFLQLYVLQSKLLTTFPWHILIERILSPTFFFYAECSLVISLVLSTHYYCPICMIFIRINEFACKIHIFLWIHCLERQTISSFIKRLYIMPVLLIKIYSHSQAFSIRKLSFHYSGMNASSGSLNQTIKILKWIQSRDPVIRVDPLEAHRKKEQGSM